MNKRYKICRKVLIFWTLFIGIGALAGALCMLIDPSGKFMGMDAMLPFFQVLPFADILFQNFIFSGIMLLIVNGITNFIAFIFLVLNKKIGVVLGMIFGITLMLWIVIQFVIFPLNFMSTIYFIFGFLQFLTGVIGLIGYKQGSFKFSVEDYTNIGTDKTKLVVFFSRTGYTKKLAYEIANESGAEILEIKALDKIDGDLGFWWCGRFGMHKWGMKLHKCEFDPKQYNEITLCSPVWVFALSAPMREFCKMYSGKLTNVNYVITHFMGTKFNKVANEMDKLLNVKHQAFLSYRCHYGNLKKL